MTDYAYTDRYGDTLRIKPNTSSSAWVTTPNDGVALPADKVEEVCAALREAAGLPPVWTVEKIPSDANQSVKPILGQNGWIHRDAGMSDPEHTRFYAAQLLAAADEAEARANRPKLPTAEDSVIKLDGNVWVRLSGSWYCPGRFGGADDQHMACQDFTVLYDAEKAS
jgi:hypothetical protein